MWTQKHTTKENQTNKHALQMSQCAQINEIKKKKKATLKTPNSKQ